MVQDESQVTLGRLLYEVGRIWRRRIDSSLQMWGLTQAKWNVIAALEYDSDDSGLLQRELAQLAAVEPPTMTSLLDRMENEGWVRRESCEEDRRGKRIFLTDKASSIVEQVRALSLEVEKDVFAELSPEIYEQLRQGLMKMRSVLEVVNSNQKN